MLSVNEYYIYMSACCARCVLGQCLCVHATTSCRTFRPCQPRQVTVGPSQAMSLVQAALDRNFFTQQC